MKLFTFEFSRAIVHLAAVVIAAGALTTLAGGAHAQGAVPLFKIVTVRDDIVVGVTPQDAAVIGGADATALGRALKSGEVTLWQYAVRKAPDGALEQAPLKRVSILGHDSLRVEPYATPLRVAAPQ